MAAARRRLDEAGLLGTRIYVEKGAWNHIHLADNLADVVMVTRGCAASHVPRAELLRVVNPLGKVFSGQERLTKPFAAGSDDWTHPYHGPDNNPQSRDRIAREPYLTQYFAEPYYVPPPGVTVAAGGRIVQGPWALGISRAGMALAEHAAGDERFQRHDLVDAAAGGRLQHPPQHDDRHARHPVPGR